MKDDLVCYLFRLDEKGWDTDIIDDVFEGRDKKLIYNIILSESQTANVRYWCFEMNGTYSVKSVYKLLQRMNNTWVDNDNSSTWRNLWCLRIPPKIKIFYEELWPIVYLR